MNDYDWNSRIERAFTQRIYLMEAEHMEDEATFLFKMMGNTGKPYHIRVTNGADIGCTCPDHSLWHNFCKHIMHLLIRVIGMSRRDVYDIYYKDRKFKVDDQTIRACQAWFDRKGQAANEIMLVPDDDDEGRVKRKPIEEDDDCPVCYEAFSSTSSEQTLWCRAGCGKSVHESCFLKWSQSLGNKYGSHKKVGCVYCRTEWVWN